MWNYLPRVEKIIKVPPSMMMQSWMGSDFTNDDLVKESSIVEDYLHSLIGEVKMDGFDVYKVEAIFFCCPTIVFYAILRGAF